jgi:pSer/pThr/pTyr-binding forkhead associated (FHA) protein
MDVTHTQEMPAGLRLEQNIPTFVLYDGYRRMPINEAIVTIGRSLDNDIVLDDKRVSRQHAQLRRRYEQYVLYDLDSTGGTTVNGLRIREAVLQAGDVIAFAGVKVQFKRADVVPSAPDPGLGSTSAHPMSRSKGTLR